MNFENWLNKVNKEISDRKKKDLTNWKFKNDYDKYIHNLYTVYKNDKNSKLIFIVTIILVFVTFLYTIFTLSLMITSNNQFESEYRPYIYLEYVNNSSIEYEKSEYILNITNFGRFPGKILSIETWYPECEDTKQNIIGDLKNRIILPEKEISINVSEHGDQRNNFDIKIKIKYTGVGELNKKNYEYISILRINKNNKKVSVIEGEI